METLQQGQGHTTPGEPRRGPGDRRRATPRRRVEIWGRAVLLGAVVASAAVLVWAALVRNQREQALETTRIHARSLATAIEGRFHASRDSLADLAEFWGRFGRPAHQPMWRADVLHVLEREPAVDGIAWYEPTRRRPTWIASEGGGADGIFPEALLVRAAATVAEGGFFVGEAEPTPEGSVRFHVALPVRGPATEDRGVLVAALRADHLVAEAVSDRAPGFVLDATWDGVSLRRGEGTADDAADWWVHETSVTLAAPGGRDALWTLRLRPTAEAASRQLGPLPTLVLAGGLLAAVLLAALAGTFQLARRRAAALERTNRELVAETERVRRAEAAVRRLNRELESRVEERTSALNEAVEDLEAFNYSVSHDLRSPLGAIVNLAAILEEDWGERLRESGDLEFLQRISSSARNAMAMMDGLLEFSRAGRVELRRTKVDMTELARSAAADVRAAREDGDRFDVSVADLPAAVGDERMLRIVFTNLLSNAFKFSAARETPHVRVGYTRRGDDGAYFVQDDGVGFDMRFQDKLFRLLERLHASDEYEGHGIGLAVVGRIVRRHGGRVTAEAAPDRGATFYFTLGGEP